MQFLTLLTTSAVALLSACATSPPSVSQPTQTAPTESAAKPTAPAAAPTLAAKAAAEANKTWTQHPHFIDEDRLPLLAKNVTPFPPAKSVEQRADELNLLSIQEMRTKGDCARAATEVKTNLASFYGPPYGPLTKAEVERLNPFFEQVRNDSGWFLYRIKTERARKRPFTYIKDLEPCVEKEISPSYPSGHATISRVWALILSDIFPTRTKDILKRSDQIAEDRVMAGLHHRSDIIAGQALGEQLYKEFTRSPEFRKMVAILEGKPESKSEPKSERK